jgi:hypothetical protein
LNNPLTCVILSYIALHLCRFTPTSNALNQAHKFVHTYNAEDVFELLNFHDQELTLDHRFETRKKLINLSLKPGL